MPIEFDKKEIAWIVITIIIFTFIILFPLVELNPLLLIIPAIIILTTTITKKFAAEHYNLKIKYNIWQFQRYWFTTKSYFKKPIPMGLIMPFFLAFFSIGLIKAFTFLQFDYENLPRRRMLKKSGRIRRIEINETDPAFTAAWGFYSLLVLTAISIILTMLTDLLVFADLAKYSLYYGAWNLIPISNLDGTKLFFGNLFNWIVLAIIFFIGAVETAGI